MIKAKEKNNRKKYKYQSKAYEEIKAADPNTALTEYAIRKIVYEGNIPCINAGKKKLFCMEDLEDYIHGKRWPVEELRKINMYPKDIRTK